MGCLLCELWRKSNHARKPCKEATKKFKIQHNKIMKMQRDGAREKDKIEGWHRERNREKQWGRERNRETCFSITVSISQTDLFLFYCHMLWRIGRLEFRTGYYMVRAFERRSALLLLLKKPLIFGPVIFNNPKWCKGMHIWISTNHPLS